MLLLIKNLRNIEIKEKISQNIWWIHKKVLPLHSLMKNGSVGSVAQLD